MEFKAFLIKYAEIGIKGKNRYMFEDALIRQMKFALKDVGDFAIHKQAGRVFAEAKGEMDFDEAVEALKRVFGQRIYNVPISSTKSILGHSLVASGLLECIATICCLENNKVHPTLGLKKCKNECDLFYTPQKAIDKDIRAAISTSYAFLGYNSCIVLRKNEKNG